LAEIQSKIIKKGKQNTVSRLFHAKSDKEMIAGWKSDLNKILLVFNVRSVVVVWLLLTVHSQTELALNTHTIVSGMDHNVTRVDNNVTKIHEIVSNIDSTVMKIREETGSKSPLVSIACTMFVIERTLTVTQAQTRSAISTNNGSGI
jgi:hypothetical protein